MRLFYTKPAVFYVLFACGYATADDGALGLKPDGGGLRLQLQPNLMPIPPGNKDLVPLFVDADSIQGHHDAEIEAEGTVRLRKRGKAVYADWLRYDQPAAELHARGNVSLQQRGDVMEGTELNFNMDTERGAMEKPKYQVQVSATKGRGEGERLVFEGENKYRMLSGNYTTCEVGNNDWFVRAKDFEIDKERQIGTAHSASVEFLGVPILYTPYLSFSLDRQRKSGFLAPTFGNSGNSGTEFSIPYYWNIAPNRDATITPRVMTKRGVQLLNEFRYLDPAYRGEMRYEVLPNDRVRGGDTRSALSVIHTQTLTNGWVGALNVQKASDDNYFTDLGTQITATSQVLLPRTGSLSKGGAIGTDGSWGVSTSIQRWQTLNTDPLNPIVAPYSATQASFSAVKPVADIVDTAVTANVAQFSHPTLINGTRTFAYPTLSLPLQTSFAYVTPKVGVHMTRYNFDQTNTALGDQTRTVPIFSTETGVIFERDMKLSGQSLVQTFEPKMYYVYIPTRNQNQLPVFDSSLQNTNFATLYTENQFSGNDRINDANQITTGVTSRFLQSNGVERLRAGIAQRFYFKSQEVTLPGVVARGSNNSDLLAALSGTIVPNWTADLGWQYTTDLSQTQRLNTGVRYEPEPGKVVNAAYRYTNGALVTTTGNTTLASATNPSQTLRQVDISTQWPLSRRLSAIARMNYSIADGRVLEGLGGIEYDGGCWIIRVVGHSFATTSTTSINSFFMQLELNGVSKIGSNPLELLRRNIAGYYRGTAQSVRTDDNVFPLR
ncbi:MAG: organic solvent tolerance protein [Betaproteobacteria bacterium]|nr:organic solvent tolerance protein [Betaproteobacteria bacterium]